MVFPVYIDVQTVSVISCFTIFSCTLVHGFPCDESNIKHKTETKLKTKKDFTFFLYKTKRTRLDTGLFDVLSDNNIAVYDFDHYTIGLIGVWDLVLRIQIFQ